MKRILELCTSSNSSEEEAIISSNPQTLGVELRVDSGDGDTAAQPMITVDAPVTPNAPMAPLITSVQSDELFAQAMVKNAANALPPLPDKDSAVSPGKNPPKLAGNTDIYNAIGIRNQSLLAPIKSLEASPGDIRASGENRQANDLNGVINAEQFQIGMEQSALGRARTEVVGRERRSTLTGSEGPRLFTAIKPDIPKLTVPTTRKRRNSAHSRLGFEREISFDSLEVPQNVRRKSQVVPDSKWEAKILDTVKLLKLDESVLTCLSLLFRIVEVKDMENKDTVVQDNEQLIYEKLMILLNAFVELNSKFVIVVLEMQLCDKFSLTFIKNYISQSPKVSFLMLGRPSFTYDNKEVKQAIDAIQQLNQVNRIVLKGFSLNDTRDLIQDCWDDPNVTGVSQDISLNMLTRTAGNPYLIKSLTLSMKSTGKWTVSPTGDLVPASAEVDGDSLVLGYDNQSVVLARFDRLDRNMQLFFKIAAVLGERFHLDDVLFFMTGIENLHEEMDAKVYNSMIKGVVTSDQYGFLQLDQKGSGNGAVFSFKSALVRKCVYNLMAHKQRQQAHLHAAQYYESKLTDENKWSLYIRIFEHYMEADDSHMEKKVLYLEQVAASFYKVGGCFEAVKYYRLLCELCSKMNTVQNPNFYRELGDSLLSCGYLYEARRNLIESLYLMNHEWPDSKAKLKSIFKKELAIRQKEDASFLKQEMFQVTPAEYNFPSAASARSSTSKASGLRLSVAGNALRDRERQRSADRGSAVSPTTPGPIDIMFHDARVSNIIATQHALHLLSEYYWIISDFEAYCYAVLVALNLQKECDSQNITARLFASASLILFLTNKNSSKKKSLSKTYMNVAAILDNRTDPVTSMFILFKRSKILVMQDDLEKAFETIKLATSSVKIPNTRNLYYRLMNLNMNLTLLCRSRTRAYASAKTLMPDVTHHNSWFGRFWFNFTAIHTLLLEPDARNQIFPNQPMYQHLQEFTTFTRDAPSEMQDQLRVKIAVCVLNLYIPIFTEKPTQWEEMNVMIGLLKKIDVQHWDLSLILLPLIPAFLAAISKGLITKSCPEVWILSKCLETINKTLKTLMGTQFNNPTRRIFKGIRLMALGRQKQAVSAWKKGIDDKNEAVYLQALLHFLVGHFGQANFSYQRGHSSLSTMEFGYLMDLISKKN